MDDGLQVGQCFGSGPAARFRVDAVGVLQREQRTFSVDEHVFYLERHNLISEAAGVDGSHGALMWTRGEAILLLTGYVAFADDVLGCQTHAQVYVGMGLGEAWLRGQLAATHRHQA